MNAEQQQQKQSNCNTDLKLFVNSIITLKISLAMLLRDNINVIAMEIS